MLIYLSLFLSVVSAVLCCYENCKEEACSANNEICSECKEGFFGENCTVICPANCLNDACHRKNASCILGCKGRSYGGYCENVCPGNCQSCNQLTEECSSCLDGWYGPKCNLACPNNCAGSVCEI